MGWRFMASSNRVAIGRATAVVFWLGSAVAAQAQIRTDGSLGSAAQTLGGPNFVIPQALGRLSGNNLFQSFQTFNLARGETAQFTTTTPTIAHVISRVTGGDASHINGRLQLDATSGTPAFYFINPAGVIFGDGASINMPGAFHVASASHVSFPDGRFSSDLGQSSSLSSAPPQAFGFLGARRAAVQVLAGAVLAPGHGHAMSVGGGDVNLHGGVLVTTGGDLRLLAVGSGPVEAAFSGALPVVSGDLTVEANSLVRSSSRVGLTGGQISLGAGNFTVNDDSSVLSRAPTQDAASAGGIDVLASGAMQLSNGGHVWSSSLSRQDAGPVVIQAASMELGSRGYVYSSSESAGAGGPAPLTVRVGQALRLSDGATISSDTLGVGHGEPIRIEAGSVDIGAGSYVASTTFAGSRGSTGGVQLFARDNIHIHEGGRVYVSPGSSGQSGQVSLSANHILMESKGSISSIVLEGPADASAIDVKARASLSLSGDAGILSIASSTGNAGEVRIAAREVLLDSASKVISTASAGTGNAGNIQITARESVSILHGSVVDASTLSAGQGGSITIQGKSINVDTNSKVSSVAFQGSGAGGSIQLLAAETLRLAGGAGVVASTFSDGDAGSVQLVGRDITLVGGGHARSNSLEAHGNAGSIEVAASGLLSLNEGATLTSITGLSGRGGSIRLTGTDIVMGLKSFVATSSIGGTGDAGNIDLVARRGLSINSGAFVSSDSFSNGDAGSIRVGATRFILDGVGSALSATAGVGASGRTGSIGVQASESIALSAGASITSSSDAVAPDPARFAPTTLRLNAPEIGLSDAQISAAAGGNVAASDVQIAIGNALRLNRAVISTSARLGNGGTIRIEGGSTVQLAASQITTSVLGAAGNGGDILLQADALALNTGFIQANTEALQGAGGKVDVKVKTLVASGNTIFVGGQTVQQFHPDAFAFNVIQAAAPTGVSGVIDLASPVLDLSGSLGGLVAQVLDGGGVGRNPCQGHSSSSLALGGRGGMPPSVRGLLGLGFMAPPWAAAVAATGGQGDATPWFARSCP